MPSQYSEDLFDGSKMTFGEHLEELRRALFRSIIAIAIGFLVGLYFGEGIVAWLQRPLVQALEDFQANRSVRLLQEDLRRRGEPVPSEQELHKQLGSEVLVSEEVFFDYGELLRELKRQHPELGTLPDPPSAATTAGTEPDKSNLLRMQMWRPVANLPGVRTQALNAQEAFMIYLKAAFFAGLVIASPLVFYFIWQFVASGLYPHEKRYVHVFLPMSIALFLAGAAMAFFFVFHYVLGFLFEYNDKLGIDPSPRISEWLTFALVLPVGFGLSFQLPLVMLFLERIGVVSVTTYQQKWRIAVLVISIISMILTPADPISMLLMFVPLTILYFGGILLCRYMPRAQSPFAEPIPD